MMHVVMQGGLSPTVRGQEAEEKVVLVVGPHGPHGPHGQPLTDSLSGQLPSASRPVEVTMLSSSSLFGISAPSLYL